MKKNNMFRKGIMFAILILFIGTGITQGTVVGSRTIIYVDDDNTEGPWDGIQEYPYQHIKDGIYAANDGKYRFDRIDDYVDCGNNESLNITDAILTATQVTFKDTNYVGNLVNPDPKNVIIELNATGTAYGHELLWKANTTGTNYEESAVAFVDDVAYIGSCSTHGDGHDKLFAVNATNGDILWGTFIGPGYVGPVIDGDVIYIGTCLHTPAEADMYAINRTTGNQIWNVSIPGGIAESVQFDDDKIYFCSGFGNKTIYALNKVDGSINWTYYTGLYYCANKPMLKDNAVYAAFYSPGGKLFKINATDGSEIWSIALSAGPWDNSITSDSEGRIFLALYYGRTMNAYNETNGSLIWSYRLHGRSLSFNAYRNGVVFISDTSGYVYALNSTDGALIWENKIGNTIDISSPTLSGGLLFIGTRDFSEGAFFALNETTGEVLWKYTVGASVTAPPSIANGMMLCGTDDWYMYAFDFGVGSGNWTLHRYDSKNTAYSPDGLTTWQYVEANCTTDVNITSCTITNYYDHDVTNITLNIDFSADWYDSSWNLLKSDSDYYTIDSLSSSSSMTLFIVQTGSIDTVYVDDDYNSSTPGWQVYCFDSIQDGIDAVNIGGTVYVYNGTYYENVVIDKTIDLIGEDRDITIIDGGGVDDVVYLSADSVNITGFTIQNSGTNLYDAGIHVGSYYNTISGNYFTNNQKGIYTYQSSNNTISENEFTENWMGITLYYQSCDNVISGNNFVDSNTAIAIQISCNNIISENTFINIGGSSVGLSRSSNNNTITSNHVIGHSNYGIYLEGIQGSCSNNYIAGNYINNSIVGMWLSHSSANTISKNMITNNSAYGIEFEYSFNNIVSENDVINNTDARISYSIEIRHSSNNTILKNNFKDNDYGIWIAYSSNDNIVYHNNFIENGQNAYDECTNTWYNEAFQQGNYWSDFDEPGEGAYDNDTNGIVDDPYDIPGDSNQDMYPLMEPWVVIPGDCDDDGDVDQSDLGILLAAWNSRPGDGNWDYRADLDGDGHVDQSDLGILLANWDSGT